MEIEGQAVYTLRNDLIEIAVIPSIGGKVHSILNRMTGREWLWRHPTLGLHAPPGTGGYHDSGGHDECFPTIAPCVLPRPGKEDVIILDHGELWAIPWAIEEYTERPSGGGVLDMSVFLSKLNCRFRRRIEVPPENGPVTMSYELENRGTDPLPYLWAGHTLIKLEKGMRLSFPNRAHARVELVIGDWPGSGKGIHPLPGTPGIDVIPDVDAAGFRGYSLKAFVENLAEGWAAITAPSGEEFRFEFPPEQVDSVALWLNCRGWAGTGTTPYFNLGFEPMIGAADSLEEVLHHRGKAGRVEPGRCNHWYLRLTIDRIPPPVGDSTPITSKEHHHAKT